PYLLAVGGIPLRVHRQTTQVRIAQRLGIDIILRGCMAGAALDHRGNTPHHVLGHTQFRQLAAGQLCRSLLVDATPVCVGVLCRSALARTSPNVGWHAARTQAGASISPMKLSFLLQSTGQDIVSPVREWLAPVLPPSPTATPSAEADACPDGVNPDVSEIGC